MPLSSELAVNRLKLSNTAGKITQNSGQNNIFTFKLKPKTNLTFRNIFGNATWADYYSFSDYVQNLDRIDLATALLTDIYTPITGTISGAAIIYESQEDVIDAVTGITPPAGKIVYVSTSTFAHDIGDVPLPLNIFSAQTIFPNTDVTIENGNRMTNIFVA